MRGASEQQTALYSYVTLERRVPKDHPLREKQLRDREMAPHVSEYTKGQNMGKNSLTEEERNEKRPQKPLQYAISGYSKSTPTLCLQINRSFSATCSAHRSPPKGDDRTYDGRTYSEIP